LRNILIIFILLSAPIAWSQDLVIDQNEKSEKNVDFYNSKASKQSDPDSIYFYYNRAIIIAQNISYYKGELKACKGLIKLFQDDEEIYERLRYTLLLVRLYERNGTNANKAEGYQKLGKLYFNERLCSKASEIFRKAFNLDG